jgi:Fic family protein
MASLRDLLEHIKIQHQTLQKLLPLSDEQQKKLDKKFRLEFNYNSNHLEGNTLTYGETELLLLFDQTTGDHEYREYEEMKAHDVALKMVEQEAGDLERPLTEQFIRSLNKHLLVREFWKEAITPDGQPTRKKIIPGDYKKTPNSVRLQNGEIFDYTAPEKVAEEIAELVQWYNEHEATEDPIVLASLLHYRFVRIHPFDDGNGRVSRLLMNYVLLRKGYPVVVVKSAEKKEYLAALNKADTGDIPAFTAHIAEQVIWSFDLWLKAAKGEDIDEPDDLDKELALLKNELDQKPDNFDKRGSEELIIEILSNDILKLFHSLADKLLSLKDYFVSIDCFLIHSGYDNERNLRNVNITLIKNDDKPIFDLNTEINRTTGFEIHLDCVALKKVKNKMNISIENHIEFSEFHYSIYSRDHDQILTKPYGQHLSENEIKSVVNNNVHYIIDKIKEATGLNN